MSNYWAQVCEGFADTSYSGPIPKRLYRYRGMDPKNFSKRLDQELGEREIFLSALSDLNDKDEGLIPVVFQGSDREIARFWLDRFNQLFPGFSESERIIAAAKELKHIRLNRGAPHPEVVPRLKEALGELGRVACFTENPLEKHMWEKYGVWKNDDVPVQHGGICIGYSAGEDWRLLGIAPVAYSNFRPPLNPIALEKNPALFREAMFIKSREWEREAEWRIFLNFRPEHIGNSRLAEFSRLRVDEEDIPEVILGANAPDILTEKVLTIAKARATPLSVKRVILNGNELEVLVVQ